MNRTSKRAAAVTAGLLGCLISSAPSAQAATGTSYQGIWTEATASTCTQAPASGRWSVRLRSDGTAIVGLTMFLNDELHAAWGGVEFQWVETSAGYVLTAPGLTFTFDATNIRLDIPDRYPGCDGYALGVVRS